MAVTGGDSGSLIPMLTQPRRLAVLAYLVLARPRGLHSRDTLVAMLWPESDQAAGRHALRNVLHAIRRSLGEGVIITAGDGMVGVDSTLVHCDAIELGKDLEAGRVDEAIARYRGELLQGFHVSEAPDFERWLDAERRWTSDTVLAGVWSLAEKKREAGDLEGAAKTARAALVIAPEDELALRRLLQFLEDAGDRFGVVRVYEEFSTRLKREYGANPSPETAALVRTLCENPMRTAAPVTRGRAAPAVAAVSDPGAAALAQTMSAAAAHPIAAAVGLEPVGALSGDAPPAVPVKPVLAASAPKRAARWTWAAAFGVLATLALVVWMFRPPQESPVPPSAKKLLILPMENATGDPALDYVGAGLADGIATRLEGIGGITVRSGARSAWPSTTRHDLREMGRQFGSVILLKTVLRRLDDSLEVRASLLDLATNGERAIASRRFTLNGLRDMESNLAASVAGGVFRVPLPAMPQQSNRKIDPESYRLTLLGWHQLLTFGGAAAAKASFLAATQLDPTNARAWSGLSSALSSGGAGSGEYPIELVEAAAARALALDSLQGSALANMGFARAQHYRNLADGLVWLNKAAAVDPSNPEVFLLFYALYLAAWEWDKALDAIRIAQRLDPLSVRWVRREAFLETCAGRPERALAVYRTVLSTIPSDTLAQSGVISTLARLGRYDEAIAAWRKQSALTGDTVLAAVLNRAHGKSGYLEAKHRDGRRRLLVLQRSIPGKGPSPVNVMRARFAAGDIDGGFADIEKLIASKTSTTYRLRCFPELDEVRESDRFAAVLKRAGPLPQR